MDRIRSVEPRSVGALLPHHQNIMKNIAYVAAVCVLAVLCSAYGAAQSPEYARSKKPAGYYLEVPNYYNGIRIPPGPPRVARPGYSWDRFQTSQGVQWVEKAAFSRPYYRVPNYYRMHNTLPVVIEQPIVVRPPFFVNRYYW